PALCYVNPRAAIDFIRDAFGFELDLLIEDEAGNLAHSQMAYGDGKIMVGNEWSADHKSPQSIGMKCTQTVHMHLQESIDAHCEKARRAGAEIIAECETQFYGDRTYRARDPEGHIWTFSQTVEAMTPEEWDKKTGLKTWSREA
ncbi:MAG: VOC family protein, partial [Hyphomonadaceae bacterium]|nr:VOC family protein [Hyphomonadaceae bacterium]